ncbi:MAG: hypothetical protein O7G13_11685 [Alphaproteobacteria bacterium]|nr:hypothetical protein [Alphaproteobacteria bacterium]
MTKFTRESTKVEKPSTRADGVENDLSTDQWLNIRKERGRKIDANTAEVEWCYAQVLDPYGIDPDLPEECRSIGRAYFARSPDSEIWVWFGDLPDEVRKKFWTLYRSELAFPVGLGYRNITNPDAGVRDCEAQTGSNALKFF